MSTLPAMEDVDTEKRVIETIRQVFFNKGRSAPPLTCDTILDTSIGLESIDFAELVVRLEQVFDRDPFANGDVPAIRTIRDLAKLYTS